ncbi:STAS domain-containing protein [Jeotgalibacillus sp. S-D1]|uniref:STAS domain-containing protein n=1 Tax=Jeotgalibacillus sp. S-D1 TaxID=2552189 RepID=UPI0010595705|nr:STAS domain-containing protein [Jeotgalibacillus sp. S-D1]TDL31921.1 STAS domain-containing protein [Jeotgalibacillus sp. S-D1]
MTNEYNIDSSSYPSLAVASKRIFTIISERLNVNTAYVAKKGESAMTVISSYNKNEQIIQEGYSVEYGGTYCRLIISNNNYVHIPDLSKDELTCELEVTSLLNTKGFLGVPLTDLQGEIFGTLCVMDKEEMAFGEAEIDYLKAMAEILSHMIELDKTQFHMGFLNVPIIPITEGVAILSLQGIIDENRSENIMRTVLHYGTDHQLNHFIIDLSGLIILDGVFPRVLANLVQSLQLMGITPIITGITPQIATHDLENGELSQLDTKIVRSLESALEYIGFYLIEKK